MRNVFDLMLTFIVVLFITLIITWVGADVRWKEAKRTFQAEAVQRGFAEYNSTNGIWQWKTNVVTVSTNK